MQNNCSPQILKMPTSFLLSSCKTREKQIEGVVSETHNTVEKREEKERRKREKKDSEIKFSPGDEKHPSTHRGKGAQQMPSSRPCCTRTDFPFGMLLSRLSDVNVLLTWTLSSRLVPCRPTAVQAGMACCELCIRQAQPPLYEVCHHPFLLRRTSQRDSISGWI